MKVLVDTDIIIDVLRKKKAPAAEGIIRKVENSELDGYISVITILELYVGARLNPDPEKARRGVDKMLRVFRKIDVTEDLSKKAGNELGRLHKEGIAVEENDVIIGMSALAMDMDYIVTRNHDHYKRIKDMDRILRRPDEID